MTQEEVKELLAQMAAQTINQLKQIGIL